MELSAAPEGPADPRGLPQFGAYQGGLRTSRLDRFAAPFARGGVRALLAEKRWQYVCVASPDLVLAAAVVRLGYLGDGFLYVFDRKERRLLAEREVRVPPFLARVDDAPEGVASLVSLRTRLDLGGVSAPGDRRLRLVWPGGAVEVRLAMAASPPALTAICPTGADRVTLTQKRACIPAEGEVRIGGRTLPVREAFASHDFSRGYFFRETRWRWASASGRTRDGRLLGLNFVEGHNDGPVTENAAWLDGKVRPLGRVRFHFDRHQAEQPWRIESEDGSVQLRFEPEGVRRQALDVGLLASQYVQPIGRFSGRLRVDGEVVEVADLVGVTEDHRSVW